MPFINEESRQSVENGEIKTVGDRCYIFYRKMIRAWRESPRWTTAHNLHKEMMDNLHYLGTDDRSAYMLAWQVFFNLYVMPYEVTKREENGEVE